jgi:hypothetical protein
MTKDTTAAGFEPARAWPIAFRVQLLNHSDKQSDEPNGKKITSYKPFELRNLAQFLCSWQLH